jgi:two-component system, NtrC family, sensor histidine kinase HydH
VTLRLAWAGGGVALCMVAFAAFLLRIAAHTSRAQERSSASQQLAHILDNIPTGVLAISGTHVTMMNRSLRDRLGPAPKERGSAGVASAFPSASPGSLERISLLVETARRENREVTARGEAMILFGEEGHYTVHAVPVDLVSTSAVLLVVEDLSEVSALSHHLVRAEKLATVGVLAAGIADEIGAPLADLHARAESLRGKPAGEMAEGLATVVEQIDALTQVIGRLHELAAPQEPVKRPVALGSLAREVAQLLALEAHRKEVDVEVDVPEALAPLAADPDQLEQVLLNLVMNACDACDPGGHVVLSARPERRTNPTLPNRVIIEVRDDGCGIDEESRHRIFDPFFTTKARGQGTGLGLSVVGRIVQSHGASIRVESAGKRGTCVVMTWPSIVPARQQAAV